MFTRAGASASDSAEPEIYQPAAAMAAIPTTIGIAFFIGISSKTAAPRHRFRPIFGSRAEYPPQNRNE
ncbi:MAG: hypothetical protein CMJ90_10020 [Planctomycetes bacterium]|nr:hypothetical protein [Planctomycetota bacterium]